MERKRKDGGRRWSRSDMQRLQMKIYFSLYRSLRFFFIFFLAFGSKRKWKKLLQWHFKKNFVFFVVFLFLSNVGMNEHFRYEERLMDGCWMDTVRIDSRIWIFSFVVVFIFFFFSIFLLLSLKLWNEYKYKLFLWILRILDTESTEST